ncbi:unannotated protein [freshwater metagenome]|uniref:Unannotated protein n=1 Tax=freshwater metagenome TaxID=449393 RepID=A0A6J7SM60_9ZZZZ
MHERQSQTDRDSSEARRGDALSDQKNHQNKCGGEQYLEKEGASCVDRAVVVGVCAQPAGVVGDTEIGHEEFKYATRSDRTDELGNPIAKSFTGRHPTA